MGEELHCLLQIILSDNMTEMHVAFIKVISLKKSKQTSKANLMVNLK